ncbi:phage holin family protein [Tessaracoccus flavescens]|uniref:Phage holin family protein n=1 Tax=Tessaracoccus flavescens TaxID=399497 RepID=A0A1Q2CV30_9ACTN|nr:phage holin family protein [Tessaracoccus flavescens]AQP49958.1 hypothetical protein BW733_03005 [Tessaracoccus flavescens]
MKFLTRLIVTAIATAAAVWLIPGIDLTAADTSDKVITLLVVALIFGVVNAIVKPVVTVVSTCLVVLTLGLFLLVINALMLLLTSWLSTQFGLGFHVDGFWPALFGSIVISIVGSLLGGLLNVDKEKSRS